jgi:5-methylthioadenosine/S-adenosylhomocysteine deaminase
LTRKEGTVVDSTVVIRNGIVLTMEDGQPPMVGGTVVVRGSRLAEVTPASQPTDRTPGATEIDASGCVVMPGLVNCHAHVRPMRGLGEDMDVMTWHNQYVDGVSVPMTPEDAYFGAANAYLEMLRNGTTTVMAMSIGRAGGRSCLTPCTVSVFRIAGSCLVPRRPKRSWP